MGRTKRRYQRKLVVVEGKEFHVQGYEPFFLKELDKFGLVAADVTVPTLPILYKLGRRWHRYYPDFYVKRTNTMVEVKSTWTITKNRRVNQAKWMWARAQGYTMLVLVYDAKGNRVTV